MPFIAKDKTTGQRVDITQYKTYDIPMENLACQACDGPMYVKAGMIRRAHFAHRLGECDFSLYERDQDTSPQERPEHLAGKRWLKEHLPEIDPEYSHATLEYEVPIKEVRRIVDVLARFPQGYMAAHEVQLASISREDLQKRTDDYAAAGIDVWWWLGKDADTESNREWCLQQLGGIYLLDFGMLHEYGR